jgi:TonB family protein
MNLDDEKRRSQIAGAITLLVHAVVLLIPITANIVSNQATQSVEAQGYFTGLVDLSGSPNGQPGFGIPGSGHEGGGSTVTIPESKKAITPQKNSQIKPAKIEPKGEPQHQAAETYGPRSKDPKEAVSAPTGSDSKNEAAKDSTETGKHNIPATSGEKGGAGSGSGTGIGAGTGSGAGRGEGSGSGSGSGYGNHPGPGSGPPRKGLGIGQGNVSLGPPPVYPKNAQNNGVTGKNRYHVVVGTNGKIKVTRLLSSGDQSLDNAALRTLLNRWKYPASEYAYFFEVEFAFTTESSVAKVFFIKVGWEDGLH